ncbi:MAG: helix-turn-helix transcriptional regulator [Oscillibacter sp.]|nr:helix-turn-helix transcriptional regulator [Oscillibacter sp.]
MYFRRIYDLREDHDLSQKAVAEYLNIQPNVYRRYEKGYRNFPVDVIIKLADYYHVSTDYLLGRTDDPTMMPPARNR